MKEKNFESREILKMASLCPQSRNFLYETMNLNHHGLTIFSPFFDKLILRFTVTLLQLYCFRTQYVSLSLVLCFIFENCSNLTTLIFINMLPFYWFPTLAILTITSLFGSSYSILSGNLNLELQIFSVSL